MHIVLLRIIPLVGYFFDSNATTTSKPNNIQVLILSQNKKPTLCMCYKYIPYVCKFKDVTNSTFSQLYFWGSPALQKLKVSWAFLNKCSAHPHDIVIHFLPTSIKNEIKKSMLVTHPLISGLIYQNCLQNIS